MGHLRDFFGYLPMVGRDTRPNLAAAIGFLTGGIGLALYFRSLVDFLAPVAAVVLAVALNAISAVQH